MSTEKPSRRERKKEELRETLLITALELFEEKGFTATTVEDITDHADVAPRTFFRYFATKASVLQLPTDTYREVFGAALAATPPGEPVLATLQRAVHETLVLLHDHRAIILAQNRIIIEAGLDIGADEFAYLWQAFKADLTDHLALLDETDPRPVLLTGVAVGIAAGAVERWLASGGTDDLGGLVDDGFAELVVLVGEATPPTG